MLMAAPSLGLGSPSKNGKWLREAVFENYDKLTRPGHQVELENGLSVTKLHLCHHKDIMTVDAYMKYRWTDDRLAWDESAWNGVGQLTIPWTQLWVPDIGIYNGVGEFEYASRNEMNRAIVKSDGSIIWIPQVHFQTSCSAKDKDQVQSCDIKVGPWTEDKSQLLIKPWVKTKTQEPVLEVDDYLSSKLIKITNTSIAAKTKKYDCCEEPYNRIDMNIKFKYNAA